MNRCSCFALLVCSVLNPGVQSQQTADRREAEYYVGAYAAHYNVPVRFVRAIVEQESGWRPCALSPKGAVGLMQLMPTTAARRGVRDRCNIAQNVSGGIRYLAWLMHKFRGDLRLAAAAYLAGEEVIARRGLLYRNREVVAYVSRIRKRSSGTVEFRRIAGAAHFYRGKDPFQRKVPGGAATRSTADLSADDPASVSWGLGRAR